MMTDKDKVYITKREFVEKMNEALSMLPEIKAVEYRNIRDKYQEYLRVTYECGEHIFINVTGDSLGMIVKEISGLMLGRSLETEITEPAHVAIIEGWFEAAR